MLRKLSKLNVTQKPTRDMYNDLVERVNLLSNITARGGGLSLSIGAGGINIKLSGGVSFGNLIRRAATAEVAGANNTILCNLIDSSGIEVTEGDGFNITVYCSVVGSVPHPLSDTSPNLNFIGQPVFVTEMPYDNEGTVENRWYMLDIFQTFDTCT